MNTDGVKGRNVQSLITQFEGKIQKQKGKEADSASRTSSAGEKILVPTGTNTEAPVKSLSKEAVTHLEQPVKVIS